MRRILLFFLIGLISLFAFCQEGFAFSIEPSRIEISVPAGGRRGKTILVDNSGSDIALHLKVYTQDINYLPDGSNEFLTPGTTQWSCAEWIDVMPSELDIPAGQTAKVRLSVAAPVDVRGGYYAIVFFESQPLYYQQGIGVNFRLGGLVAVTISKTELRQGRLADISFLPPQEVEISIFNEGNVLIRPQGKVKIFNYRGKRLQQLDFNPSRLGILPKTLRKFNLELEKPLAKDDYRLKVEIDYGAKYLLLGELPFSID